MWQMEVKQQPSSSERVGNRCSGASQPDLLAHLVGAGQWPVHTPQCTQISFSFSESWLTRSCSPKVKNASFIFQSHGLRSLAVVRARCKFLCPHGSQSVLVFFPASHLLFFLTASPPDLVTSDPQPDAEAPAFHRTLHHHYITSNS